MKQKKLEVTFIPMTNGSFRWYLVETDPMSSICNDEWTKYKQTTDVRTTETKNPISSLGAINIQMQKSFL